MSKLVVFESSNVNHKHLSTEQNPPPGSVESFLFSQGTWIPVCQMVVIYLANRFENPKTSKGAKTQKKTAETCNESLFA